MEWVYAWIGFLGGAAAFTHCLGMCGGFPLHFAQGRGRDVLVRQTLWHMGRMFMYSFLGALAGFAGGAAASFLNLNAPWLQNGLALITGTVMLVMGLVILGVVPVAARGELAFEGLLASFLGPLFRDTTPGGALLLGMATGCLPCPVVLGFLALSMHSGSPLEGMMLMGGVAMGTMWSLVLLGMVGRAAAKRLRRFGTAAGGILLVIFGVVTMMRGTTFLHHLFSYGSSCCPVPVSVNPAISDHVDTPTEPS